MTNKQIRRYLAYFKKSQDALIGEVPLRNLDLPKIRARLNADSDDPLYESYPIDQSFVEILTPALSIPHQFDFDEFDYFLECASIKEK